MRNSVIIAFLFFSNLAGFAKCGAYGLTVYPCSDNISLNSLFILQGYADSLGIVDSLNIKHPI